MTERSRITKRIYVASAALGLMLGTAGIAMAVSDGNAAPAQTSTEIEANVQEPAYESSIATSEDDDQTEAEEQAALEGLALITSDDAETAAASVDGTVVEVDLDNENGAVVYSVEKRQDDGTTIDVKVDASTGEILGQDADDDSEAEATEADDDNVEHENEFDGAEDNDPDEGHED